MKLTKAEFTFKNGLSCTYTTARKTPSELCKEYQTLIGVPEATMLVDGYYDENCAIINCGEVAHLFAKVVDDGRD